MLTLLAAAIGGRLVAQDDLSQPAGEAAKVDLSLQAMYRSAAQYTLTSADEPGHSFALRQAPLLRFSNPVSGNKDGAVFLWIDRGRPQAALKLFTYDNKSFTHFWQSLSDGPMVATRGGKAIWNPEVPGGQFQEVPDAPKPAGSATERLRQMKALAARFSATYTADHLNSKASELRMLPRPLYRYEASSAQPDGSVFAFVESTSPVLLLLFETRQVESADRWHYGLAAVVTGPVTARLGDAEVFTSKKDHSSRDRRLPYLQLHGQPAPE
jgi:hypothetical protein